MRVCDRCDLPCSHPNGWWFHAMVDSHFGKDLCPTCVAIVMSDDTDHGDEHVATAEDSIELHATGTRHRARECRVCFKAGVPLRPDVEWVGLRP